MLRQSSRGTYTLESSDLDIRFVSGKEARSTCPVCSATRHHPEDPSLSVDTTTGAGICHHCHARFLVTDYSDGLKPAEVKPQRTEPSGLLHLRHRHRRHCHRHRQIPEGEESQGHRHRPGACRLPRHHQGRSRPPRHSGHRCQFRAGNSGHLRSR